ncbi:hypothetical protein LG634_02705 [Streptomyces bambusae]|uniref:hypothetical protein n=1 Tax=Streptomyces bambusae TaxID=1550616 RepID=UPI001CFC540D|nr:hypothetical protein [Streptomyces bambusae]MCB5163755.1 hypothetical protein [Streptomyces bambusae]
MLESAAETEPDELPVLRRPAAEAGDGTGAETGAGARYLGGIHHARDREQSEGACEEHFAGLWRTGEGVVAVVYPLEPMFAEAAELLDVHTAAGTIVVVKHAYALDGPELGAVDRARPDLAYSPSWAELSAHLGAPAPWWPSALRRPAHLTAWRPGDEPRPVEVVTHPSWEALYAFAEREPAGSAVRRACFTIGHRIRAGTSESASKRMENLRDWAEKPGEPFPMVFPAVPDTDDPGLAEVAADDVVAAGLAALCARTDDAAVECLEDVSLWSGEDLPYGGTFNLMRTDVTRAAAEWINRLRQVHATALHRVEGADYDTVGTFVDPVTGSPVVAVKGKFLHRDTHEITYIGRAPKRLPAGSVLKEVVLDDPVWIRTTDGTVYPAPAMDAPGLAWGYRGSGPLTLAECIGRLLDDGAAHAVTYDDDGRSEESGLSALFVKDLPRGTRISRRELERARNSA